MTAAVAPARRDHPLTRLGRHAAQHRRDVRLAVLYSALNKLFDVLPEILIGVAVDVVVNRQASFLARAGIVDPKLQLLALAALTVLIWVGESVFEYLYQLKWRRLAQDLQHALRLDAYAHVQQLDMAYFERERSGKLLAVLNEDINQLERFLNTGANDLIQVFVGSLLVGVVFFVLTAQLAFLALIPVPFILYGAFWFQRRLAPRYASMREAAGGLSARVNNNLQGIATIKAYTAEATETAHVRAASDAYRVRNGDAIRWAAAITPVIRIAILAGFTVTLLYGGFMALDGRIGVGSYSALVYLTQRLLWPLTRLADLTDLYQRAMASIERVMDLLHTPVAIQSGPRRLPRAAVRGELQFEDLRFSYDPPDTPAAARRWALDGVDLRIAPGEVHAFVGSTGSGKSTLTKLLLRLYEAPPGAIRLDGHPLSEFDLGDLRRAIGYVAQDSFLTDGSVAENIAYGLPADDPRHTPQAIEAAARAAEAHDFVCALPEGYDTPVGERGLRLSGGQRQRLALARAILKDPPILVLDEATSALDTRTEQDIQAALRLVSSHRTTLIIAHRLSTVVDADQIMVLDHGRVVERGTHGELVVLGGAYARMWAMQAEQQEAIAAK